MCSSLIRHSKPLTSTESGHVSATVTASPTTGTATATASYTVITSGSVVLTLPLTESTVGTLNFTPVNVARVSSTDGGFATATTDANGSSIYVSGTYTSYVTQPTGKGGKNGNGGGNGGNGGDGSGGSGGGGGSSTRSFGGLGAGGLTAIIAIVLLVVLTAFVVLLRRYRARKRADRLQGWLAGWRHGQNGFGDAAGVTEAGGMGGAGAPEMAERPRVRPRSDDSFGTPEHSMARASSATPSMTSGSEAFFSVNNDHISVGSSHSEHNVPRFVAPALPALPEIFRNGRLNAADLFEDDDDDEVDGKRLSSAAMPSAIAHPPSPDHRVRDEVPGLTSFPRKAIRNSNRISQLTIRPVPFNSNGAIASNDSRASLQSLPDIAMTNPFLDNTHRGSMQSEVSQWTARSVDLLSFPRPPSRSTAYTNPAGRSILGGASRVSLQSRGDITPARSDFNFVLNSFSNGTNTAGNRGSGIGNSGGSGNRGGNGSGSSGSGEQDAYDYNNYGELDPFADNLEPGLPSPMPSSAARSLFFPSDPNGSDSARLSAQPSNLTRIARSWAPSKRNSDGLALEEMAVAAGDIVRVISRHSMMPNMSGEELNASGVLGGWALVKRMDPETGISKRGFVPINCLMDTQGPASVP